MSMATMLSHSDEEGQPYYRAGNSAMSTALLQAAAEASNQHFPESPPDDVDGESDRPAKRAKRSRACQACRGMKIRCLPVEGQEACKACSKVNRTCIMPGPARKRQKTVHKVAELEQKINALTASLAAKSNGENEPTPPTTESPQTASTPSVSQPATKVERSAYYYDMPKSMAEQCAEEGIPFDQVMEAAEARLLGSLERALHNEEYIDVVSRNRVSEEVATKIFTRWKNEMCPYCPVVAFADTITIDWLRHHRPMTLLAILGVACGTIRPELQEDFMVESAKQLSHRVSFLHEKSLDLVQAMLIAPLWFTKHKFAKDLNFNNAIHSAVAMCLDLGLGKRSRKPQSSDDMEDLEKRRTWMGCYYMSGTVAAVLRLPQLLKFSPYLEECVERLSTSQNALRTDRFVCSLVQLLHIHEDVGVVFEMDDPGSTVQMKDSRTQYQLKVFEHRLRDWKKFTQNLIPEELLNQYEAVSNLYIHEIALHNEHNVDDFRPIVHEHVYGRSSQSTITVPKDFLTSAHLESLAVCVDSMEKAMSALHNTSQMVLRGLPCIHMVWTCYVAVAMIRLHGILQASDVKYGSLFLPQMRVEYHLDNIIQRLNSIVAEKAHSPCESFVLAFRKLRAWQVLRENVANRDNKSQLSKQQDKSETSKKVSSASTVAGKEPRESTDANTIEISRQTLMDRSGPSLPNPSQTQPGDYSFPPNNNAEIGQFQFPQSQTQQQQYVQNSLLDPNAPFDASAFDVGNWDFNLNELNNFDAYMSDVGWMGHLM